MIRVLPSLMFVRGDNGNEVLWFCVLSERQAVVVCRHEYFDV